MEPRPSVSIARCASYDVAVLLPALEELVKPFGGVRALFRPGAHVLVKPNLIAAHSAASGATTHPALIEALLIHLHACGARAFVGDSPAFGSAHGVARACGLADVVRRTGATMVEFKRNVSLARTPAHDEWFQTLPRSVQQKLRGLSTVTASLREFDCVINVPKLKAHVQTVYTGAVKNVYGCVRGKVKALRHGMVQNDCELFMLMLLSIYQRVAPELTIVDAIEVMEGRGPRGGTMRSVGLLFGGRDAIAMDTVIAQCMGKAPDEIPLLAAARKYGVGVTDRAHIDVCGVSDATLRDVVLPRERMQISFSLKTVVRSVVRHCMTLLREAGFVKKT